VVQTSRRWHDGFMSKPAAKTMSPASWVALIVLSLVWGSSFLFGRIAVMEIPPLTLTLLRVGLAAITLNVLLLVMQSRVTHTPGLWRDFTVMGLLNNIIPFTLIFYGQQEIGAGLAAIVNAMTPIWTVLIAHLTTADERFSRGKAIGIFLGFYGVALLIGSAALAGLEASAWAQMAILGATISYGVASVFGRRFTDVPPIQTARGQLTTSTVLMLPLALFVERSWTLAMPSLGVWAAVVALAVLCTAFAYILFFRILAQAGATNVALVTFLIPPSAILMGVLFLGETLELRHAIGFALILAGLIAIDGRAAQTFTARRGVR
jgi:drug/metabolite transporter (DMT)-like permease